MLRTQKSMRPMKTLLPAVYKAFLKLRLVQPQSFNLDNRRRKSCNHLRSTVS